MARRAVIFVCITFAIFCASLRAFRRCKACVMIPARGSILGYPSSERPICTTMYGTRQQPSSSNTNKKQAHNDKNTYTSNNIEAVGFDMDYTLAAYKQAFDHLTFDCAKEKLVSQCGYPRTVLDLSYQPGLCRRGVLIDRARGNLLKLDKHRYVRSVIHGTTLFNREQRKAIYRDSYQESERFSGADFVSVDTPFSLVDACLFAQLVHLKDSAISASSDAAFWQGKTYTILWQDLRKCVDRSHRDGSIKQVVAADPARFIHFDPKLISMLTAFRRAGKKVFLLTNSLWEYTHVVMNYLEGKKAGGDKNFAWLELFDLVLVGGNKPAFLLEQSLPVYAVDPLDGSLSNLDAGPMSLETHRVLQGGDHRMLLRLLGLTAGDRLLYVGDHVYSDVLRSKRSLGWRTCLIVPELQQEIVSHGRLMRDRQTLLSLRRQQVQLESLLDELELQLLQRQLQLQRNRDTPLDTSLVATEEAEALQTLIGMRRVELGQLTAKLSSRLASFDAQFDSQWGQLLRSGWQESRLASQIRDNACIFTSRASNLGQMSPYRPLRPSERDVAPHDLHLLYNEVVDYDATFQPHIIFE